MPDKLKSRKLWATILGSILLPILSAHGVPPPVTSWLGAIISTYVAGQSVADGLAVMGRTDLTSQGSATVAK